MKGYLDNPEATSATICSDGWLHTGDIAKYNENHQFFIVGRLKELIKVKGYQVRFIQIIVNKEMKIVTMIHALPIQN